MNSLTSHPHGNLPLRHGRGFSSLIISMLAALFLLVAPSGAHASDYPLENILPKEMAEALAKQNVKTTSQLLAAGNTNAKRRKLAKTTSLQRKLLRQWIEMSDVMRIRGVGPKMATLLRATRVRTIAKLKRQRAKTLLPRMLKVNAKKKISQNPPGHSQVTQWITQAKTLKIVLQ